MATAYSTALDQLLDEPGMRNLGRKITLTYTAAATFTTADAEIMKGGASAYDAEAFKDNWVWIPGAAAANLKRTIISMTVSSTVATVTVNVAFTAGETAVTGYILAFDPDILINLANDCITYDLFLECFIPLYHGPASADMQGSAVDTDWTESGATVTVQTTAAEVWAGAQSLVVTDSGSGGDYTQSALQGLGQARSVQMHFVAKADVGTAIFHALDASSNSQGSIQTTQEWWVYGTKTVQFDAGEEQIRLRIEGDSAAAAVDVQFFWFVRTGESMFNLPAWVAERFNVTRIDKAVFHQAGGEADTYMANSVEYTPLEKGVDYRFIARTADANPTQVWVAAQHLSDALFVVVRCPYGAPYGVSTLFTGYTATNSVPVLPLVAAWKRRIGGYAPTHFPEAEGRGAEELTKAVPQRTNEDPPKRKWRGLGRIW